MANQPQCLGASSSSVKLRESQHCPSRGKDGELNASEVQEEEEEEEEEEEGEGGGDARVEEEEEEEVEKLEREVNEMAQKLLQYRSTLPDQLKSAMASVLAAQRPDLPRSQSVSEPGISRDADPGTSSSHEALMEDQETNDKIKLLKDKITNNASAMFLGLKRMNDCIYRMEKIGSSDDIIHPAFKRKKS